MTSPSSVDEIGYPSLYEEHLLNSADKADEPRILSTTDLKSPLLQFEDALNGNSQRSHRNRHKNRNETHRKYIKVAAVYTQDAIHLRRPQDRIQQPGIDILICGHRFLLSPLKCYKFVHSSWWKMFLYVVIWTHLLSIIFAPKNYENSAPDEFNDIQLVPCTQYIIYYNSPLFLS